MSHEPAVRRGAALLDAEREHWYERVDPDTLDMTSVILDVLGQLEGNYRRGLIALGVEGDPAELGFTLSMDSPYSEWRKLGDAWRIAIFARRARTTEDVTERSS